MHVAHADAVRQMFAYCSGNAEVVVSAPCVTVYLVVPVSCCAQTYSASIHLVMPCLRLLAVRYASHALLTGSAILCHHLLHLAERHHVNGLCHRCQAVGGRECNLRLVALYALLCGYEDDTVRGAAAVDGC